MTLPASSQLVALLGSATGFIMVDLYTITLSVPPQSVVGPLVLRYSAGQTNVQVGGLLYQIGPAFERGKTRRRIGVQVDELDLLVYPHVNIDPAADPQPTDTVGALTWYEAAWQGVFDGATLTLERAFMPSYGDTSPGTVVLFVGRIGEIDVSSTAVEMKVRSQLELLNIQMPRRLWQSPCTHLFGGAMCQFNRPSLAVSISAGAGSTSGAIATTFVPSPTNLYDQGTAIGTVGANKGIARTITKLASGVVTVKPVFLFPVAAGDQFELLPGCDRSFATCKNVFHNESHFGGFDQTPVPETAL